MYSIHKAKIILNAKKKLFNFGFFMEKGKNFIEHIIDQDLANGFDRSMLKFRFPPEPNGFLHIGHVKAIVLNFELAKKYNARVNLRFDDTNPENEDQVYINAIKDDISCEYSWDKECYASDYFEQLCDWAIELIKEGNAYIDSQSSEEIAAQKGTPTEPGKKARIETGQLLKAWTCLIK